MNPKASRALACRAKRASRVAARRLTGADYYGGAGVVGAVPREWCARLGSWLCRCLMLLIACRR